MVFLAKLPKNPINESRSLRVLGVKDLFGVNQKYFGLTTPKFGGPGVLDGPAPLHVDGHLPAIAHQSPEMDT